jgi:hypothetical protein
MSNKACPVQDTPRDHFSRLPLEIIKFIFEYLDPVESTCLGLVGKTFYTMYKLMHRAPLRLDTPWKKGMAGNPTMLHGFLEGWAAGNRCRLFRRYSASGRPRLIFEKLPGEDDNQETQPV